jgi:hypothetical protein
LVTPYKAFQFNPPLFLYFPGLVRGNHAGMCVEVEFMDGETVFVPATLVEKLDVKVGDMVHTCTSFVTHGINPDERWSPCRVVRRDGDGLLLQDGTGEQFESQIEQIAVLPKGYQMFDGKFERVAEHLARALPPTLPTDGDVHVVRTERWEDAPDDPITRDQVEALISADTELNWSPAPWESMTRDRVVVRRIAIQWRGEPCFWWTGHKIRCTAPTESQLTKLIEMAIELDANVVGDNGEEFH